MRLFFAFVLIALTAGAGGAERLWVNDITVNEYNMTWNYIETYTGADSVTYRISIDSNNDSFINAWELLNADRELRKWLKDTIEREPDIRIDNETRRIEMMDVGSALSPEAIGEAHAAGPIVNEYSVTYRFKDSILNSSSIWFLGQANTRVTIAMPAGVDIINISGMDNITKNITDRTEITGYFSEISKDRGEITLNLTGNTSIRVPDANSDVNVSNTTSTAPAEPEENSAKPMALSKIRGAVIIGIGSVIILLIYLFKIKRR
ncbi:hypothetical protein ANME2D_00941 [Candidatus Methanoperedens nitroreducens]|uniref:Uncharacterized protein n=1 Tax=Candidatus Methanoperedens nitratireducens TaxID=1392998 RepID=A0A062V7J2_9EURY|nr:hypothetical protein [Candidatus Methanoperedens nitroreducens]KCZ72513.1 hypothetical protein ANME2D_00941 [Candidatus Methanoperedens nitroreducens]MDJ1423553.1 hypothetical protein [Candidatus Methanoperedens sp.]